MSDSKRKPNEMHSEKFYRIMAETLGEEIFVTDGEGKVLFANPASAKMIGLPASKMIGRNVRDLEKEGYVRPSVTTRVLKSGKQENIIQEVRDGTSVLATAVPVYDDKHEKIELIISTSKDVDAVNKLLNTVATQNEEITNLRDNIMQEEGFIAADASMEQIKETITRIAPLDLPVLIEGETGVGKEVAVRAIHRFSERKDGPLFKINCGTIPESLIESELFGYERGAFTGAEKSGKKGKMEMAEGGTLFLDEIGEMPLALQTRLLEFLQEGTVVRIGGTKPIHINTRVVAATNRNLREMSEAKEFRMDLYYRLSAIPLRIPPLRERPDDIDALIKYFLTKYNSKYGMQKKADADFVKAARWHTWPGNIRELEHVLERTYIMSAGETLRKEDLETILQSDKSNVDSSKVLCLGIIPLKEAKRQLEHQLVTKAYKEFGSTYKAADALEVDQSTISKILNKYK